MNASAPVQKVGKAVDAQHAILPCTSAFCKRSARAAAGSNLTSVQAVTKLRSSVEQGQPYDGQQMFKTIYHRFRAQKKLQDCYKLLEEGARLQLQEGQLNCGVELAEMLVEVPCCSVVIRTMLDQHKVL